MADPQRRTKMSGSKIGAWPMLFRILGPVGASGAGGDMPLGGPRHRVLLATLLTSPGRVVGADRLIESLWDEMPPRRAVEMLHVRISELRRLLRAATGDRSVIVTRRPGYLLDIAAEQIDAHRFERSAASARQALAVGDAPGASQQLGAALGLWRGPALADLADRAFAQPEITRLENLRAQAIEDRINAELAAGRHREVIAELEGLVRAQPLHERYRAQLMLALYREGRQSDALEAYQQAADRLCDELGLDPGIDLRNLRDAILSHDRSLLPAGQPPPTARSLPTHNLPVQFTSFIGREDELSELDALLATSRLVTLTGVGGAGKSRLALEAAAGQLGFRPDGVWLVELGAVLETELVDSTVAQVLRVPEHPQHPLREQIVERLRKCDALLLLDNCEHLVAAVSRLVRDLLRACPNLRVLCTSRERLGITGEVVRTTTGLALSGPDGTDAMQRCDAVRLFVERASAVHADPRLDGLQLAAVAEICRRLDGLPLAIELAAARTTILAPAQIATRLDSRFRLLTGGSRDALPQHQTLRAVVDWSYELLDAEEQRFFDRLAVFVGSFTLEAAELICAADGDPEAVAGLLARLVDKSLVVTDSVDLPEYRYRLLETLREYALERLAARDECAEVRDRHSAHFLALAERAATGLRTGEQRAWLQRLSVEHGNLRAALDHDIATWNRARAAVLAGSLYQFWDLHGHYAEGRRWLGQVRQYAEGVPARVRARVLMGIATLAVIQGDFDEAVEACEEARAVCGASGDTAGLAHALQYLGLVAIFMGDLDRARTLLVASSDTALAGDAAWEQGWALFFLATAALAESSFAEADRLVEHAEQVLRPVGDQEALSWVLCTRGMAAWGRGDDEVAARALAAGLRSFHDLGGLWGISLALTGCGLLITRHPAAAGSAVRIIASAEALRESAGIGKPWFVETWLHDSLKILMERLGTPAFDREWQNGWCTAPAVAVQAALDELVPGHGLRPRQAA